MNKNNLTQEKSLNFEVEDINLDNLNSIGKNYQSQLQNENLLENPANN